MVWQSVRKCLRNPYFARTSNDRIAVCVILFGAHLALWYETCHVLPYYQPDSSLRSLLHIIFSVFVYANSLANIYKMASTRTASELAALGASENMNWPYCERCMLHRPPRAHHCPACDVCILRRDHHCWFGGSCVGHANQRYYICAIFYMFLATLYSNIFHWSFVLERLSHLGRVGAPMCIIAPHVCAVFGFLSLYEFLVAVLTFIAAMLLMVLAWLLVIQVIQIINGQTRHERKVGVESYNHGLTKNICAVLGDRWYIAWLCPWIRSALPENGVDFKVSEVKSK